MAVPRREGTTYRAPTRTLNVGWGRAVTARLRSCPDEELGAGRRMPGSPRRECGEYQQAAAKPGATNALSGRGPLEFAIVYSQQSYMVKTTGNCASPLIIRA